MLHYQATYLIVAVMAAFLGFGALGGWGGIMVQALYFIFLGMFFLSFIFKSPERVNRSDIDRRKERK